MNFLDRQQKGLTKIVKPELSEPSILAPRQ